MTSLTNTYNLWACLFLENVKLTTFYDLLMINRCDDIHKYVNYVIQIHAPSEVSVNFKRLLVKRCRIKMIICIQYFVHFTQINGRNLNYIAEIITNYLRICLHKKLELFITIKVFGRTIFNCIVFVYESKSNNERSESYLKYSSICLVNCRMKGKITTFNI